MITGLRTLLPFQLLIYNLKCLLKIQFNMDCSEGGCYVLAFIYALLSGASKSGASAEVQAMLGTLHSTQSCRFLTQKNLPKSIINQMDVLQECRTLCGYFRNTYSVQFQAGYQDAVFRCESAFRQSSGN